MTVTATDEDILVGTRNVLLDISKSTRLAARAVDESDSAADAVAHMRTQANRMRKVAHLLDTLAIRTALSG